MANIQLINDWVSDYKRLDISSSSQLHNYSISVTNHPELIHAIYNVLEDEKYHPEVRCQIYIIIHWLIFFILYSSWKQHVISCLISIVPKRRIYEYSRSCSFRRSLGSTWQTIKIQILHANCTCVLMSFYLEFIILKWSLMMGHLLEEPFAFQSWPNHQFIMSHYHQLSNHNQHWPNTLYINLSQE